MVFTWFVNPCGPSVRPRHRGPFSPALIPQSKWVPHWGCLKFHRRVHYLILLSLIPLMPLRLPALSPPTGEHLACYLTLLNHVTVWRDHCGRGFHAHTHSIISCRDTLLFCFFLSGSFQEKKERVTSRCFISYDSLKNRCSIATRNRVESEKCECIFESYQ